MQKNKSFFEKGRKKYRVKIRLDENIEDRG